MFFRRPGGPAVVSWAVCHRHWRGGGAVAARWPSVPPSPHPYAAVAAAPTPLPLATPATPCACASAKAGCAERQYTIEQLRLAAHSILSAAKSGKPLAAATAARQQGAASMRLTLTRLMEQVWELDGPGPDPAGFGLDKWLVRSDYVNAYEFAKKGNDNFTARRIFSEQDSGMGLDFITVRDIMNMFIAKEDLKDPFSGHLYKPTLTFVRKWAKRVGVKVYKTSSISKDRAVKATVEIRDDWFGLVETYVRELHARGLIENVVPLPSMLVTARGPGGRPGARGNDSYARYRSDLALRN